MVFISRHQYQFRFSVSQQRHCIPGTVSIPVCGHTRSAPTCIHGSCDCVAHDACPSERLGTRHSATEEHCATASGYNLLFQCQYDERSNQRGIQPSMSFSRVRLTYRPTSARLGSLGQPPTGSWIDKVRHQPEWFLIVHKTYLVVETLDICKACLLKARLLQFFSLDIEGSLQLTPTFGV